MSQEVPSSVVVLVPVPVLVLVSLLVPVPVLVSVPVPVPGAAWAEGSTSRSRLVSPKSPLHRRKPVRDMAVVYRGQGGAFAWL